MSRTEKSIYVYQKQDIYFLTNYISVSSKPLKTRSEMNVFFNIYIYIYIYTYIYIYIYIYIYVCVCVCVRVCDSASNCRILIGLCK